MSSLASAIPLTAPWSAEDTAADRYDPPCVMEIFNLKASYIHQMAWLYFGLRIPVRKALRGVSLQVPRTGIMAVVGPSGSGKSTLLRCLEKPKAKGLRISGGPVQYNGQDINAQDARWKIVRGSDDRTSLKIENYHFILDPIHASGIAERKLSDSYSVMKEMLQSVGLWSDNEGWLYRPVEVLSGGQRQRLFVAAAAVVEPDVLLLDEPTRGQDPENAVRIESLIRERAGHSAVVVATHDFNLVRNSDELVHMDNGEIVFHGSMVDVERGNVPAETNNFLSRFRL